MKPHPRIRKTVKWGGAAATVLLGVMWVGSWWWTIGWGSAKGRGAALGYGKLVIAGDCPGQVPIISRGAHFYGPFKPDPEWWFKASPLGTPLPYLDVPIWAFAVVTCACSACAWRLDTLARRRARLNLCPNCNYDRAGLAGGAKCPECGSPPT